MITMHPSEKLTKRFFTNRQIASIENFKNKKEKGIAKSLKEGDKKYFAHGQERMKFNIHHVNVFSQIHFL